MIKILRVGDPHVKVTNIEESHRLMRFVQEKALEYGVDRIELLGDQFHSHSIVRLEVQDFWNHWLNELGGKFHLVALVGNHDQSGDYHSKLNALAVFHREQKSSMKIVDSPCVIGPFGYVPHVHGNDTFIEMANSLKSQGAKVLICHQTLNGSTYDNGMYAPDGADPELLDYQVIISGHIHTRQQYLTDEGQNVIYPGTARWDTLSDANKQKGIWLYTHDDDGNILGEEMISTDGVCEPIISIEWKEGDEQPVIREGSRTTVELIGTSNWITKQKNSLKGKVGIKSRITDKNRPKTRKNGLNLHDFVQNQFETNIDKNSLLLYAKELGIV